MKKTFTQFFLFAIFCIASLNLNAQTYVLNESEEVKININASKTYEVSGPGATLSFDAKKGGYTTGPLRIDQYVNGQWEKDIYSLSNGDLSTSYKSYSCSVSRYATQIRFYNEGSLNKVFKNVKVTLATYADAPAHSSWTAPTANVGAADELAETTLAWSNVAPFVVTLSGEGASQFTCAITNNASLGKHGVATISASYKHNVAGTHNAVLTISNGTATYEIALTGTTNKMDQTIKWSEQYAGRKLSIGQIVTDAATALGGAVTYTSSDENIIAIVNEGTGFKAVAAGVAMVYATQSGDDMWNEVTDSLEFTVVEKQLQYIYWVDNLTRLKLGVDSAVVLTAIAQVMQEDELVEAPERTALITYQSADSSVVVIAGDSLIVVGEGETVVTAILPGDENYEAAELSMPVRVLVSSGECENYVLEALDEFSIEYSVLGYERIYEPAAFTGPGHILTFEARSGSSTRVGPIQIQQYVNGEWQTIDDANPGTDWRSYYYELDRNATKIRFYNGYGSYTRYFKNVLVTQATYLETTTPAVVVEKSVIGDQVSKDIHIQYSNLPDEVVVTLLSEQAQLSDAKINCECGAYGEKVITYSVQPTAVGTILDTVVVANETTGFTLTIPVTIHTQRYTQTIIWNDDLSNVVATDLVSLTASAVNEVTYSTSDSAVAYVDSLNQLVIQSAGVVTITAYAAESELYSAAELSKTITILHAEQSIEWGFENETIEIGDSLNLYTDICTAISTSGLEVVYSYSEDWAEYVTFDDITGTVVAVAEGVIVITAKQEGNHIYAAAEEVYATLTIVLEEDGTSTGVEDIDVANNRAVKQIINGQIYIIRGGHTYDIQGRIVR